jgi:MaoC like domain
MTSLLMLAHQGPILRALGHVAVKSAFGPTAAPVPSLPTPWVEATLPPRPATLVRDYVRHVGGDPSAYRATLPAHLFPQWSFALLAPTIASLPYPTPRIVNAGCRLQMSAPLPIAEPLYVRARIESIEDDGQRAWIHQRVITGTKASPEAVVADMHAVVPLGRPAGKSATKKAPRVVPLTAKEVGFFSLSGNAGRDFALLTGDVNPIHWLKVAAKGAGFRGCILHGFSTLARAIETLHRSVFAGDIRALRSVEVRFVRPLVLPARVGVYALGQSLYVGDAVGGGAYLEGTYEVNQHG